MEFRCVYDPELSAEKGRNGGKPRFEKLRGGATPDPRQPLPQPPLRGKRAGFGSRGPDALAWGPKPRPKPPAVSERLLVSGFDVLATRTDAYNALAAIGAVRECNLVADRNTGASLGACTVIFESETGAKTCLQLAKAHQLRIGMSDAETCQDPTGTRESELLDRAHAAYVKRQERQAWEKQKESKRAAKEAAKEAARAAAPQVSMEMMTPSQRRQWLIDNVADSTYIYIAAHWLPVQKVRVDELERFVGGFRPVKIVANRQGFYVVFGDLESANKCYQTLNGKRFHGYDVHMNLCGPATQQLRDQEETKQDVVKQLALEMVEALHKDVRQRVVYPYVRDYLAELVKNRPVPVSTVSVVPTTTTTTTQGIRFRKKHQLETPTESDSKRIKQSVDDSESEPEVKPISPEESNDQLPELSEEEDELSDMEVDMEESTTISGWNPEPGYLPLPVEPVPADKYGTSFLKAIVDDEDLAFAKAALDAPTTTLTENEIAREVAKMAAREATHRSIEVDGLVVDWAVPANPSWRTYGRRSYPIETKRMWVPAHRHKDAIDVIEYSDEVEVPLSLTDAYTGTVPAGNTGTLDTAERERREKRGQSRRMAKALSYNKSVYGMNTDLFLENQLNKSTKRVRLARSAIHDWGLYAGEPIAPQDFVIEYIGEALREEFGDIREREYISEGIDSSYLFRIDADVIVDATKKGNLARFINHSCQPNCVAKIITLEKRKRIALYAIRDIEVGEELTFDYKFAAEEGEERVVCYCGAEKCRGFLA